MNEPPLVLVVNRSPFADVQVGGSSSPKLVRKIKGNKSPMASE